MSPISARRNDFRKIGEFAFDTRRKIRHIAHANENLLLGRVDAEFDVATIGNELRKFVQSLLRQNNPLFEPRTQRATNRRRRLDTRQTVSVGRRHLHATILRHAHRNARKLLPRAVFRNAKPRLIDEFLKLERTHFEARFGIEVLNLRILEDVHARQPRLEVARKGAPRSK